MANKESCEIVLTNSERRALKYFRQFMVSPGQMLCFYGPDLKKHGAALKRLTDREMLIKEKFKGGYSLTETGYHAMVSCAE